MRLCRSIPRFLLAPLPALIFAIAAKGLNSTTVTLNSSLNPSSYGQPVTITATVTSGATGKVTFYDGTTILGIGTLSGTTASFTTTLLASGTRLLRAHYGGDLSNSSSDSVSVSQTVVPVTSLGLHAAVSNQVGLNPNAVAAGDFNGDHKADLAVPNFDQSNSSQGSVSVFLGNGDGSFQTAVSYATDVNPTIVLVGDWNGDGKADLLVASAALSSINILLGNGDGTFQSAIKTTAFPIQAMAVGDFNGDGKADLVIASGYQANTMAILLGNGDGTFHARVNYTLPAAAYSVAVGDLNRDGKADLVFGTASGFVSVALGNGDGTFATPLNYSAGPSPENVVLGDFNGDGKLDIAAADNNNLSDPLEVLLGNGDGTFQPGASPAAERGALLAVDLNGDGKLDVLVSTGNYTLVVLPGNGDGTFGTASTYALPSGAFGSFVAADFNGDGKADIAVANYFNNNISILLGGAAPDLTISLNHGAGLTQGQTVAVYNITVSNVGDFASAGSVSVVDSLPSGLTATAISGDGWTCVLATLSCTRSDVLMPGNSYPWIKLTVNVGNSVSGSVTNIVTVTGGGDANAANNTATDTTNSRFPTAVSLTSSPNPSVLGQAVTLTATVTSGSTGKVTFYDVTSGVATVLGLAALSGTHASLTTKLLPSGTRSIFARYDADNNYGPSASAAITQVVNAVSINGYQPPLTYHAGAGATSIAVADMNGDGKLDLITGNLTDHSVSVLLGNGDGSFRNAVTYLVGTSGNGAVAVADLNGDGKMDVVVPYSNFPSTAFFGLYVLFGNGDGTLQTPVGRAPNANYRDVKIADFNQDGNLDVLAADGSSHAGYLLLGNGDGTFQNGLPLPATLDNDFLENFWSIADLNHDGNLDLVVTNSGFAQPISVFLGNGDGTFRAPVNYPGLPAQYPDALTAADFNGDGKPDIAMLYWTGIGVLLGNGDGSLQPVLPTNLTGEVPWKPVLVGDFNGDGKLDYAYRGYVDTTFSIVTGKGDGTFQPVVSTFMTSGAGGAMVLADFNGDGKPDIAVANGSNSDGLGTSNDTVNIFLGAAFSGLQIGVSHVGNITAGKTKTYQISVTNPAFAPTSGVVSVTGILPAGLSATAISGDGWSCSLGTNTCTRSDALVTGVSYPPVALTAFASGSLSPSTVVPSASVTYAGVTNSTTDPTTIVSPTSTLLTISPNPATLGQLVTLTATVSSGSTGSVLFLNGADFLGLGLLSGNQATLATRLIPAGIHKITATYSGDSTHGPSESAAVSLTVNGVAANSLLSGTTLSTGAGPTTVLTGDLNGDGRTDLVVVNQVANTVSVFLGNGDGTFQSSLDYNVGAQPTNAAIADFNRDGKPDLAVANQGDSSISILLNQGNGNFVPGPTITIATSSAVVASDFDGDGNPDLALFGSASLVNILYGLGDGTFQTVSGPVGACCDNGLVAADFNGDGKPDLLTGATVHLNNGDRTFQSGIYTNVAANAWATADLNGDGKADLVATITAGNVVGVLLGNGDGTFQNVVNYPVGTNPIGVTIADMNGDGKLDLIATSTLNTISVLLGNGDGTFQPAIAYTVGPESESVAAGDFNNDGRTDLAVANYGNNTVNILLGASGGSPRIASSHTGSFYNGQVGATYSLTVSNPGSAAILGTFTATDVLPGSLTATAIGGSGWTCVLATLTCTEFTTLQAGTQLPPIIVTVNVAVNAPSQVTNLVTVSVPGAVSGSGSDVTNIGALLAAAVPLSPVNGQTGVSQTPSLSWSAAAGAASYDVYFGTQSTPPLVTNTTATSYAPGTLAIGTTYYWRIVSRNSTGTATTSTLNFVTQAATGFTPIRVHAGGGSYSDPGTGNFWSADTGFLNGSTFSTVSSIGNTTTVPLYETERWNTGTLEYRFSVPNGSYNVNLKFAEIYFSSPGQRVFNIVLNGQTVLPSFDPLQAAGGANLAIDKSFPVTVTNGQVDIQLVAVVSNPKISAIEITAGAAQSPPPPNTFTPIRVNAGGPAYTDGGTGYLWSADQGFLDGSTYSTGSSIGNTTNPILYQTERWSSGTLEYLFPVPNGAYSVNLKFAEIFFNSPGQRVFNIVLNGQTVLSSFDPLRAAGGANLAIDKPFPVTVTNGQIDIQLVAIVSNPKISGIEITSGTVQPPPPPPSFTPIRVHAGGAAYTDPGTGNLWSADMGYLNGSTYSTVSSIGNTTTAPLYQTERWNTGTLEYSFTVPNGTYTVNLKFAEIYFSSSGQRVFNIVLNNQTMLPSFDPFVAAGGSNLAIDRSFPITVTNGQIDIKLVGIVSNPKISAIEIH